MAHVTTTREATHDSAWGAYRTLQLAFVIAPIVAGIDKFFHFLVNWDHYLAPAVAERLPIAPHTFMLAVGLVEIVAGLLVAISPRAGGTIVGLWLLGIVVNLVLGGFYDIALRDLGLSLGAFSLAQLAGAMARRRVVVERTTAVPVTREPLPTP